MNVKVMSQFRENTNIFSYYIIYMFQLWFPTQNLGEQDNKEQKFPFLTQNDNF